MTHWPRGPRNSFHSKRFYELLSGRPTNNINKKKNDLWMLLSNISSWSLACNLIFIMEINDKHTEFLVIYLFFLLKICLLDYANTDMYYPSMSKLAKDSFVIHSQFWVVTLLLQCLILSLLHGLMPISYYLGPKVNRQYPVSNFREIPLKLNT